MTVRTLPPPFRLEFPGGESAPIHFGTDSSRADHHDDGSLAVSCLGSETPIALGPLLRKRLDGVRAIHAIEGTVELGTVAVLRLGDLDDPRRFVVGFVPIG